MLVDVNLKNAVDIHGKTVIIRTNFDVPINNGIVEDTTRIEDALPTLTYLQQQNCRLVILSHYDRPDGVFDNDKSLRPIIPILESKLKTPIHFVDYNKDYHHFRPGNEAITLMDNLRFYNEEEANDPAFATHLASLGDVYVNEAFANCHRAHASMVGIPSHLPAYAGLGLWKEISLIHQITTAPKRPLVVVIGGAKLETKEPLVKAFISTADSILVGGKIALDLQQKGQSLPRVTLAHLTPDGKDITVESAQAFSKIIMAAGTIIWNGSMGMFEHPHYQQGTKIVAEAINTTPGFTVVGGGDTEAALTELHLESGIDYISTGGGALLSYLSDGSLVAIEALTKSKV